MFNSMTNFKDTPDINEIANENHENVKREIFT